MSYFCSNLENLNSRYFSNRVRYLPFKKHALIFRKTVKFKMFTHKINKEFPVMMQSRFENAIVTIFLLFRQFLG